jgi:outer membrane protein OmpA-like peptidoglycan-associated protein
LLQAGALPALPRHFFPSLMAEQAQRRAPMALAQEKSTDNNHAYEELRHLIVAPETEGLAAIEERLDNLEKRTEDVSQVVAEAIHMRRATGDQALADALAPTIQETLRESVRRDPHVLADALFPVMGPAIRKSITETLRSMLESFNEALDNSFSVRGLQWRIEAMRTGKPFAEIVLMHSLLYRVEQVFLIHRETGLVLNHIVAPTVATQDPDLIAGMLSAIQQFVRDSFQAQNSETLGSLNVGDLQVWIEESPNAVLAAVIRGHAPADFRQAMNETLEDIQRYFSSALANFKGDAGPFRTADERLSKLLETRYRESPAAKKKPRTALIVGGIALALLIGWLGYSTYLLWEWSQFLGALRKQPGIVVVSYTQDGRTFHIQGFRDPLAADPKMLVSQAGLDPEKADLQLAPYYSLDDAIVAKRAEELLHPPATVKLATKEGELRAEGSAPQEWIAKLEERAPWIAGVTKVDDSHLVNSNLQQLFTLKASVESVVLLFPLGSADLEAGQGAKLPELQTRLRELQSQSQTFHQIATIDLVGHSDTTGIEGTNLVLSAQRAEQIRRFLLKSGIKRDVLRSSGVGTTQPLRTEDSEEGRQLNRSVTFKVSFAPAGAATAAPSNASATAPPGN